MRNVADFVLPFDLIFTVTNRFRCLYLIGIAGLNEIPFEGSGAGEEGFEAYTQRQFVTESNNINGLADHHIWSTIKNLPATLPEPSSMNRGPRTGVTGAVSLSDLDSIKGSGTVGRGRWFVDRGP